MLDCCTRAPFWKPFWSALFLNFCIVFYRIVQNEASKSGQILPSWAGAWGAWVIVVFYKRLFPKTLNKKQQAPKLPKHPPKRAGFDNFLDPHCRAFCRTVCKFAPKRVSKMASKMIPLFYSMALLGPSRGATVGDP